MIQAVRRHPFTSSPALGYAAGVVLAILAQLVRLRLDSPTLIPYITAVPFMVLSASFGGLAPGLLTTGLCVLESMYFAAEPTGTLALRDTHDWLGSAVLGFTGVVSSVLFERMKRGQLTAASARVIFQNSPAALVLLRGPEFTIDMVNPAYEALTQGRTMAGRTVGEVWPEAAHLILPLLEMVRRARTVYHADEMPLPLRRGPDSPIEERFFNFSYVPLTGLHSAGEVQILGVVIEVTAQKKAEHELRATYQELAAIHANAPVALLLVDEELRVQKVNELAAQLAGRAAQDLLGLRHGEVLGCLNALADPRGCGYGPVCGDCGIRLAVLDTLSSATRHHNIESCGMYSASGHAQERCFLVSTAPVRYDGTNKALVCLEDITDLKRTVHQLESALQEKTVLLKEVHHRVKNNLAVISSLLGMQADAGGPEARLALSESHRRVHSIALIHEHLYGNEHLNRVNFSEYAQQLVQELYSAFVREEGRISLKIDVEPIELDIHWAVPCALILNELLSNAFKHAFPAGRSGEIRVSFRESGPGYLELVVQDNGIGSLAGGNAQSSQSTGLSIVRILTTQLDGSLEQEACSGMRFVLRFPGGSPLRATVSN